MFSRGMGSYSRVGYMFFSLVMLLVVLFSLSSAAGAADVGLRGISVIRYSDAIGGPQAGLPRYGLVKLSSNRTSELAYIKQNSPSTRVLAYKEPTVARNCSTSTTSTPPGCGSLVSYAEALAHDNAFPSDKWLVRDASGNPIPERYYAGDYLINVGSASYQQRALSYALSTIQSPTPDFDGMFFDNVNPAYLYRAKLNASGGPTQGYVNGTLLSDSVWRSNMVGFMSSVGGGLRTKGYYVGANGGVASDSTGAPTSTWWREIGPHVNGLGIEYFQQSSIQTRPMFYNDPASWMGHYNEWLSLVDTAQSLGKDFIGGGHGTVGETAKMMYGKAAFLLKWNGGGGTYYWMPTDLSDPWNLAWTTDIGTPSSAMFAVGTGWRRNYSGGTVLVNPNKPGGSAITFSLGASYKTPAGTLVSSVTLAPVTAMILTGASTTTAPSTTTPTPRPGWSFCSWEATRCSFSGTLEVSYGANGKFTAPRTFTGGVDCNNAVFGDPAPGARKWCETRPVSTSTPTPRAGWTFCSWENTRCSFTGTLTVSYGANGKFTAPRTFTGGVSCSNAVFGDPAPGVRKWCEKR